MQSRLSAIFEGLLRCYSRVAPTERGGYRLARFVRRFRRRESWRGTFRTPDDFTIDLDLQTYPDCSMAFGLYELDTARTIKRILKSGDHFVDGGANIGCFTLLAGKCVGPTGRIDAFEPDPANRQRLEENLRRNAMQDRVNVHPVALSNAAGELQLYSPPPETDNHGTASIFPDPSWKETDKIHIQRVNAVRMDEVLSGTNPKLIKLDVEGAEALVVQGMTGLLKADHPPSIVMEFNPHKSGAAGVDSNEAVRHILEVQPKYEVFSIGWRLRSCGLEDLPKLRQGNLLLRARD